MDLNVLDIDSAAWGKWKMVKRTRKTKATKAKDEEEDEDDDIAPEAMVDKKEEIDESELTELQKKIKDPLDKSIKELGLDDIIPEDPEYAKAMTK